MARQSRRRLTVAEREQRRQADRDRLERAARDLLSSEGWERWIKVRASNGLCRYSLRNQWLIASECAGRGITPTYVAGFRAFLALNRCIRKGETAIRVLAPMAVTERDADGEQTGERKVFFRTVPVFDTLSRDLLRGVVGRCGSAVEDARQRATRRSHGGAGEEPGERRARAAVRPLVRAPGTRIG
jgi:N-terminal domain of anti-restriction factor ArdC